MHKIKIGLAVLSEAFAAFLGYSSSRMKTFPRRYIETIPQQFLELFFKTIGVIRDCLQSFNPEFFRDESVKFDTGNFSDDYFGRCHNLALTILLFAIAHENHTFKGNITSEWTSWEKDYYTQHNRLYNHSGRIPSIQYEINRNIIPAGSLSPLKQTGLYEKGDYY